MGYYSPTNTDLNIVRQSNKTVYSRVELLNSDFKIIDVLEGNLIEDNININADSNIRRTYSLSLVVTDSSFLVGYDKKIWLDKYIRPYVGIKEQRSGDVAYYSQGTYVILSTSYHYDETSKTLTLDCSDMMSLLNGDRNGNLSGLNFTITAGNKAREVIITLLSEVGINKYLIEDMNYDIPYDLEFNAGVSYYEIFSEIVGLYSNLDMYFDKDGIFTIRKIPTCLEEDIVLDDSLMDYVVISEDLDRPFTDIYNHVEVWGQQIEFDYGTTTTATYSNNIYNAIIDGITELTRGEIYGITIGQTNQFDCQININSYGALYVTNDDGSHVKAGSFEVGTHAFKYRMTNGVYNLYWLGLYQVYAEATETNINSPFHPSNLGKVVSYTFADGEYDNIYSNSLALDRAKYELYHACRMNDTISLTILPIPWLDVNWKIEYTSYTTKETKQYIIKNISGSLTSGNYQITMINFYDDDPFL